MNGTVKLLGDLDLIRISSDRISPDRISSDRIS